MINNLNTDKNILNILSAFALEASELIDGNADAGGVSIFICKSAYTARNLYKDMNLLSCRRSAFFEKNGEVKQTISIETKHKKAVLCEEIIPASILYTLLNSESNKDANIAVSLILTYQSFLSNVPSLLDIDETIIKVKKGHILDRNNLIDALLAFGYEKTEYIQDPFQFSVRGELIDIYGGETDSPVRIDFFDDEVQDIRYFDINSQRSIHKIDNYIIFPLKDNVLKKKLNILELIEKPLIFAEESDLNNNKGNINEVINIIDRNNSRRINNNDPANQDELNFTVNAATGCNSEIDVLENQLNNLLKKYNNDIFYFNLNTDGSYIRSAKNYYKLDYYSDDFFSKKRKFLISPEQHPSEKRKDIIDENEFKKEINNADFFENIRELNPGDFVVHVNHGIGKFTGIKTITSGNLTADYFEIIYAGGDKVYVPSEKIYLIHKYINSGESEPELNKLGTRTWEKSKKKAKEKIEEIAKDLIELYAKRKSEQGFAFSKEDESYREFEENFEYEETEDQIKAIKDVLADMESNKPMDRLVCGDVGYGKTEVAIRAAFKAAMDGKQVVFLAPTTLLVEQHFTNFTKRFEKYPIKIAYLSRFMSAKKEKETVKLIESGKIDIIIGTHKLLSDKIKLKDPGLLVIDEEQKFGAFQKEKLKKLKSSIDVLALSATPIPRTLYLSVSGIRDISILNTAPIGRKNIHTVISLYNETLIKEYIYREIMRGGQVYFIDNRIAHLESLLNKFSKFMPDIRIGVAHGRLDAGSLEEIMHKFYHKEYDMLLSTSIIESGLDNPNVNTIIINNAEGLGLSQLYQLRGRVGRSYLQAYCVLLTNSEELTKEQNKRIAAIMEYNDLGSGFRLAMADLEIRGAGNILGGAQSGNINSIGLEMCMQMLKDEIKKIEGKVLPLEIFPEVKANLNMYIPDGYIKDSKIKLSFYRRLSTCGSIEEVCSIEEELIDRFGRYPEEVDNLINVSKLKVYMRKIKVKFIDIHKEGFDIEFYNHSDENNKNGEDFRLERGECRGRFYDSRDELRPETYIPEFSDIQTSNDLNDGNVEFAKALISFVNDKEILSKYMINFISEYKLKIKMKKNKNDLKDNSYNAIANHTPDIGAIIFILQEIDRYVNI
ncbi:MAG: transcription-repair coupling factor [Candidatus Acididesulfobacter guangdongensis]|uniref:Transcription-repair-coupling factor n=1 Tax=Acididesulfobacter guangdongensis TaxID=2597225 RepID=A0A519BG83_ACIG2|nr:MAG: transcription-repair coupling factor [Candidatus Acididesulfobacter guangdongensis]